MPINVTDMSALVKDFMIASIKAKYPNLDTSDNSPFVDLFVSPMQSVIKPLISALNKQEINQNLDNAEYMTEDELDAIGMGNYLMPRKTGQSSVATLTLSFSTISNADNLVIPAGVTFSTSSGLKYELISEQSFTPTQLYTMYNSTTFYYEITIPVQALGVGTAYNVAENQIINCDITFNNNLVSVTNKSAATGGTDKENNIDYAQRMKEYYISRHIGTSYGFKQYILENFDEVKDIYVSGYGDEFMTRDTVLVYNPTTGDRVPKNIGGKTDIYIKGCNYAPNMATVALNSNNLFLQTDYSSIVLDSFQITNSTDTTKTVTFTSSKDSSTGKCVIKLLNPDSSHLSYDPSTANSITVYYKYTDSDNNQIGRVETFTVGLTKVELLHPFQGIIDIQDTTTSVSYSNSKYYNINQGGIIGTSQEVTTISFTSEMDIIPNGNKISINYNINDTINILNKIFNYEENRIVTTDILFLPAKQVYVDVGFRIKTKPGYVLDDFKISAIKTSVASFFEKSPLGNEIQEADIVSWLYSDTSIKQYLDFIALPFDSFYVTTDISADIISPKRDGTYLDSKKIEYPVLNKINVLPV